MNFKKLINRSICFFVSLSLSLTSVAYADLEGINENIAGALLADLETGTIFHEYNIDEPLAIASISKLMTYAVLMDEISAGRINLTDEITISYNAANTWGSKFGLYEGEKLTVSQMIEALLIVSGNDVSIAIAEHVSGSEEAFVELMNAKCFELGLTSAIFINSSGLPKDYNSTEQNMMSINDLYSFVVYLLNTYPQVLETTQKPELIMPERNYQKSSTNPLFGVVEGLDGLKTGTTDEAGLCLISTLPVEAQTSDSLDYRVIAIVMGTENNEDRIEKSSELLEFGRNNFVYFKLAQKDTQMDTIFIENGKIQEVDTYLKDDLTKYVENGYIVRTEETYEDNLEAPLEAGTKVGEMKYYIGEETLTVDIVIKDAVEKVGFFESIWRFIKGLFS